ncbi:MAG TPA: DUF1592 domain-containing protein, partial [Myxococcaceae bacterium]|nr:DUF1592 domain-containing protein [Myxococcaceae bacterium]
MKAIRAATAALLLCGCVAKVSPATPSGPPPPPGNPTYDPSFACNSAATVAPTTIRRQAKIHYINSIREFLSTLAPADVAALMGAIQTQISLIPQDAGNFYTRNDTSLTQSHAGAVFDLAFALGSLIANTQSYADQLASVCGAASTQASLTGSCANAFVAHYGLKAFRRPLTTAEIADLMTDPASTATPPANLNLTTTPGLTSLLVRLLAHPRFFYRMDNEGTLISGTDGITGATYRLSPYELLSKMTYLFWDAPPTDALYAQAATTDFTQPAQSDALVQAILSDPAAKSGIQNFYTEWLGIQSIPQLDSMNSLSYKTFAAGENINVSGHNHLADMIQEIVDLTRYYTFNGTGRYEDLLNSPYSFARTTDLAQLYGLSTAWDGTDQTLVRFPSS